MNKRIKKILVEISFFFLFRSPVFSSPGGVVIRGGVINSNVRRRKAEDKMAMIFVMIVSG
jgi:hypothetical protein